MTHYKSNLRDLEFNLFEVFGADRAFGQEPYSDLDVDTARSFLAEVDRLARQDLATSYQDSDRNPPVFDPATHTAPLPESFKKSYRAFMESEFWRLDLPSELDGTNAPRALWWALAELVLARTRRSGCTPPARPSRTCCTSRAPSSRRSGPSSSSTGSGAPRWCSPSRTPARTWVPAGRGRFRSRTAHGTSRASSASSPRASTT